MISKFDNVEAAELIGNELIISGKTYRILMVEPYRVWVKTGDCPLEFRHISWE
jgi:hypothetical protein